MSLDAENSSDKMDLSEISETWDNGQTILDTTKMSKRQLKKLKKQEELLAKKAERRSAERLKRKQKRAEKLANNEDLGPSKKKLKANTMELSSCKIRVAIDCSFDYIMCDKDILKLSQQLQYCYSRNRRASNPMQFYMTSLESKTLARLEQIGFYKSWDIYKKKTSYLENFKKEEIIYLTSDSPNTLDELSHDKVYIIGGLVDHNHHKGLCYDLAVKNEVGHARLPINDFMRLSSRNVLTVNHVFEILLRFTENKNWKDAFYSVIPKRKILGSKGEHPIISGEEQIESSMDSLLEECSSNARQDDNDVEDDKNQISSSSESTVKS